MLDWLDTHSGSVVAVATFVLVAVTAYYAWTTRALVRETHITLQAGARATLQARMDRISEICIREPNLFAQLDDHNATGEEQDARFHISNMFLGVLEEAHMQYRLERSMSAEDWSAWEATADAFLPKSYVTRYWQRVASSVSSTNVFALPRSSPRALNGGSRKFRTLFRWQCQDADPSQAQDDMQPIEGPNPMGRRS